MAEIRQFFSVLFIIQKENFIQYLILYIIYRKLMKILLLVLQLYGVVVFKTRCISRIRASDFNVPVHYRTVMIVLFCFFSPCILSHLHLMAEIMLLYSTCATGQLPKSETKSTAYLRKAFWLLCTWYLLL